MGTFPASLELRNPCLPYVPWEPLAVGVGGEWSRGRGIMQIPSQTPSSSRNLESQEESRQALGREHRAQRDSGER